MTELRELTIAPKRAIIVENLETGLALPDIPATVAFMRLGNAVSLLSELPWLHDCTALYWGDIDTHGFVILIGGIGLVAFHVGPDVSGGEKLDLDA